MEKMQSSKRRLKVKIKMRFIRKSEKIKIVKGSGVCEDTLFCVLL